MKFDQLNDFQKSHILREQQNLKQAFHDFVFVTKKNMGDEDGWPEATERALETMGEVQKKQCFRTLFFKQISLSAIVRAEQLDKQIAANVR
jgi:hypothetical protein